MTIENQLYDLAMAYWDLQEKNYDIEWNYEELLDFSFIDPDLETNLGNVIDRCREIRDVERPPPEPSADIIFREEQAPAPNNSVINVVTRAIMAGGPDFRCKPGGWHLQREKLVYQVILPKNGEITVSIEDCSDQAAFVKSLNVFTLDVVMSLLGHLSFTYCENRTENPLLLSSVVTARQILRDKGVNSYGEKRWQMFENVYREMEKLAKLRIDVRNSRTRDGQENYDTHLAIIKPVKRDFNKHMKRYITTSWKVSPGRWAVYFMSSEQFRFIGKLDFDVFKYEHREQRTTQIFAKKLIYALFTVPGGTYYLEKGAKKSLAEYLELIGEYREGNNIDRKKPGRDLKRLGKAMDFLVDQGVVKTSITGSVADYITERCTPWGIRGLLRTKIEITKSPGR